MESLFNKINFLKENVCFKMSDFGVSDLEANKLNCQIVRGSVRHYAPEAIKSKNGYVFESDVFSFGNFLYEIVHLKYVFGELGVATACDKITN